MSIGYALEDGLAVVTLDDGKVNAMSQAFFDGLNAALDRAERDAPGAVVIVGRPGVFSAGLDLKLLPTLPPDTLKSTLENFGTTMLRVFTYPLPTVAAMTGHAIAGGAFLGFACDLRVMAEGPHRIHVNEVAIGLSLPTWANAIAESVMDVRWRTEAVLHARPYSPAEAYERGLVTELRPPDQVLARARELAAPLAALRHPAYGDTKRRVRMQAVRWAESVLRDEMVALPAG